MALIRRRKQQNDVDLPSTDDNENKRLKRGRKNYTCLDNCCWSIGCICTVWWLLLFLYNTMPASFPQYVTEKITGPLPDPPGVKCLKEGLGPKHPVVFVPGIVTGGLELWEGHECAEGLFRKRLWGGTFGEVYKRPSCWLQHMSLDNITGLDPSGIRVRPVSGLVAADYFAPGYFVWAVLIANLARVGYEEKNMYMAAYDWRLSFQNTEVRDQTLSRLKSNIELMVQINGGEKAVIIPHSMGVLYFLHFMKWVEAPAPMGGGGGPDWCAKHIKAVMNIGGPLLGAPKALAGLFSAEAKDIAFARGIAPGVLDSDVFHIQTLQHLMRMSRTWDSTMSMIPKGGETIWGGLDWSPEEGYYPNNTTSVSSQNESKSKARNPNYGRFISFGRDAAELHSSEIQRIDFRGAVKGRNSANSTCREVWTEYHEMGSGGIKAIAEYKTYTANDVVDMLQFVAPKMMERGNTHYSHGLADNLDDPKYAHYRHWSNALETKLPNAADMEIYSMYGVGIPTERAYVYKLTPATERCYIPFQIDNAAGDTGLKDGVYTVDGDETVPALSAGFMCAKGWRGKTRFNPSGIKTYVREYPHNPPSNFLEGRGTESGAHVDILGNFQLIEDLIRVAAGQQLDGDRVSTDIFKWSQKINLKL
ncbi:putative transferase [Helianthus annuus]|uniref:phospholipid:diacylglycerol acyltransferase n=1 Tax=Helianthus annuus TaxID=4232 RepID=A0A251VCQ4_HELAN|nr:phospholipid:diacylglycerol acyltransferase 1 [Helianthus annuus]KAF5816923.1 putative transferase [Helianthus annuus]KAJ0603463.1 putative transferase [Helianthus annuus]KAJ0613531.1 putative transferase [Helianthus annuus]KAJ0617376.1 putative transferase [Helianthus annuus]KAJ0775916.1 putative transferase [Helianthus annuus]